MNVCWQFSQSVTSTQCVSAIMQIYVEDPFIEKKRVCVCVTASHHISVVL